MPQRHRDPDDRDHRPQIRSRVSIQQLRELRTSSPSCSGILSTCWALTVAVPPVAAAASVPVNTLTRGAGVARAAPHRSAAAWSMVIASAADHVFLLTDGAADEQREPRFTAADPNRCRKPRSVIANTPDPPGGYQTGHQPEKDCHHSAVGSMVWTPVRAIGDRRALCTNAI